MNTRARSFPTLSHFLRRTASLLLLATLIFTLLPAAPADAYYNEGSQVPGTIQRRRSGGSTAPVERRCGTISDPYTHGPIYWKREGNVWRVEIIDYPFCTKNINVIVNPATNETRTFPANTPGTDWGNEGNHAYCVKYVEVLRFYGPLSNPAQYVSRSVAYPAVPCYEIEGFSGFRAAKSRSGLMAPHPHDAHRNPSGSFFQSTGTYYTTRPLSEAWQPQGNISSTGTHCPLPDDPSNLRRFFQTEWDTEEEAELARNFRRSMGLVYSDLLARVRLARLPDSVASTILNVSGTKRYAGDNFTTVNYSDGMPCSSPLDFTVRSGQQPWVYGYCAAPVVTSYRGPVWARQNGQTYKSWVETFPDAWDTSPNRDGYKRHLPDYAVESAHAYFADSGTSPAPGTDPVVRAYRNRAASILGRTDQFQFSVSPNVVGRASTMAANLPCAYGMGPVEPAQTVVQDREPVDPVTISGPSGALAYVGGVRTQQTFTFRPGPLTCNGGEACTQGQVIRQVTYNPTISVPSGWTVCSPSNRATCDYEMSWRRVGTSTLEVTLRTYTATRPGEAITVLPRGVVEVEWPRLQTEAGALSFSIAHTTSGFGTNLGLNTTISVPFVPDFISSRANVQANPLPMSVTVAGSRLNTYR